jgi:hypothetical protein
VELSVVLGFVAGGLVTAAMVVLVGSLLGWVSPTTRYVGAAVVATFLLARELGIVNYQLPERRRLIPSPRLDLPFPLGTFAFSAELGLGWRTVVPRAAPYGLLVAVMASASFPVGAVAAVGWGIGRAVPVLVAVRVRSGSVDDMSRWPVRSGRALAVAALVALVLVLVLAA